MNRFHKFCMRIVLTQEMTSRRAGPYGACCGEPVSWRQAWSEAGRMLSDG